MRPARAPRRADHLFRNNGDGTFTDDTREAGVTDTKGSTASASPGSISTTTGGSTCWSPTTRDRTTCIATSARAGFENISYPSGAALDGNGREQAHMGVAIGDYDNDGRNDIHITNFADDFNVLYHNDDGASSPT